MSTAARLTSTAIIPAHPPPEPPEGLMPAEREGIARSRFPVAGAVPAIHARRARPEAGGTGQAEDPQVAHPGAPVMIDKGTLEQLLQAHFDRLERVLVDQVSSLRGPIPDFDRLERVPVDEVSSLRGPFPHDAVVTCKTKSLSDLKTVASMSSALGRPQGAEGTPDAAAGDLRLIPAMTRGAGAAEGTCRRTFFSQRAPTTPLSVLSSTAHSIASSFFVQRRYPKSSTAVSFDSALEEDARRKEVAYRRARASRSKSRVQDSPGDSFPRPGHARFELFFAVAIVLNAISQGVELELMARTGEAAPAAAFKKIHVVFALVFAVELGLRLRAFRTGTHKLDKWWLLFDLAIVVSSLFEIILDLLATYTSADVQAVKGMSSLRVVRFLRAARLLRAFRIPRIIRYVGPLQVLIYSIGTTLRSLGWALVLLFMIMYVYSIMFAQAVVDHMADSDLSSCNEHRDLPLCAFFGDLTASTFTLFKAIAGGISWHELTEALAAMGSQWEMVFTTYIITTYFGVLNVVTGVYCSSAIEAAQRNPELVVQDLVQQQARDVSNIKTLFGRLHDVGNSTVNIMEFEELLNQDETKAYFAAVDISVNDAWELFKMLDADETGEIDIAEFVEGCLRLKGNARAIDLEKVRIQTQRQTKKLRMLVRQLEESRQLQQADSSMDTATEAPSETACPAHASSSSAGSCR